MIFISRSPFSLSLQLLSPSLTSRFSRCPGTPAATPKSASGLLPAGDAYDLEERKSDEKSVVVVVEEDEEAAVDEINEPDVVAEAPPRARAARVRNIRVGSLSLGV